MATINQIPRLEIISLFMNSFFRTKKVSNTVDSLTESKDIPDLVAYNNFASFELSQKESFEQSMDSLLRFI